MPQYESDRHSEEIMVRVPRRASSAVISVRSPMKLNHTSCRKMYECMATSNKYTLNPAEWVIHEIEVANTFRIQIVTLVFNPWNGVRFNSNIWNSAVQPLYRFWRVFQSEREEWRRRDLTFEWNLFRSHENDQNLVKSLLCDGQFQLFYILLLLLMLDSSNREILHE